MKTKLSILHFHPDGKMANKFVLPLMDKEKDLGFISELFVSRNLADRSHVIPFDLGLNFLASCPMAFYRLLKVIHTFKPDVVIAHNARSALLPLLAATVLGVRSRIYFNHGVPYIGYRGVLRFLLKNLDRANLFLSNRVLAVSKDMASLLEQISLKKYSHIELLACGSACGIDLKKFNFSNIQIKNKRVWVFIGRPEIRKGFKTVIDLWVQYFQDTDFILILCGPDESDVLKFLPDIPPNIKCLGFVDDIEDVLSSATGLILPSFHEGFSYAILEAMACGVTVVANNIPGVRNIIIDGKNGFLIEGNELNSYANVIHAIDIDYQLQHSITKEARSSSVKFERAIFLNEYGSYLLKLA